MTTNIEDRLIAALQARADLVQPEDLRHAEPPTFRAPVHQRPSTWLLAAAACLAAVVVPLAVMRGGGDDVAPAPQPTPATPRPDYSHLPHTPQGPGSQWPQVHRADTRFDVDGDGVQDEVRLRNSTGEDPTDVPWRVEVSLATGGYAGVVLDDVGFGVSLVGPTDADGNGDDEILYDAGGGWGVLELTPDGLVDLEVQEPGLAMEPDDQGHLRSTWSEDGLFTTVSLGDGYFPGDDSVRTPSTYAVDLLRWQIEGDALVPVSQGQYCVTNMDPNTPFGCDVASVNELPSFFPEATDRAPVGKQVTTGFEQSLVDLELVGDPGEVAADGDVELRVTVDGRQYAAPVPAGGEPSVYLTLLGGDAPAVLVQQGEDDPTYTVFRVQGGDLVALEPAGDPAASLDAGETWISGGTQLFTRESLGGDAYRVWTWTPTADGLVASPSDDEGDNRVCFDFAADPVTWELC